MWKLPKLVEASMASTTSIDICTNFHDFFGSLWGLVDSFKAINALENFERFPVRSRTVLLAGGVVSGSSPSTGQLVRKLEESS